jgi:endonuclease YncB( thermonuclease family)
MGAWYPPYPVAFVIMRPDQTSKSNFAHSNRTAGALRAGVVGAIVALLAPAAPAAQCDGDPQGAGPVANVTDGRTLVLADGRTVRLALIEVPPAPSQGAAATQEGAAAARAGSAALARLVTENNILLSPLGVDRHNRVLARVYLARNGQPQSIEVELLAAGHAFVSPYAGNQNCMAELKAAERKARAAKLGLWGDPYYAAKDAGDPAAVLAARGRFAIVEGRVVSVRESGGTIYVNFGRRWSEDFTVTILKRNGRLFAESGLEPKSLAGRRVRVRGVIEERGGPWIGAVAPGQIEIADR